MKFDKAFTRLIEHEGGYVNHPSDPGGETMYGITARVARANGYQGEMRYLPIETAKAIAKKCYWEAAKADSYDAAIGFQVFDAAYNHGTEQAAKFLQRAVGVLADGNIGPVTIAAVNKLPAADVVARFNGERLEFYTGLSTWAVFGRGWARRVAKNLREGV